MDVSGKSPMVRQRSRSEEILSPLRETPTRIKKPAKGKYSLLSSKWLGGKAGDIKFCATHGPLGKCVLNSKPNK